MRHIAIRHGEAELTMATADRRNWRVLIDLRTLALLDGGPVRSDGDVAGLLIRHMGTLQMAALRVIGRGGIEGDTIRLDATALRLPLTARAA